LYHWLPLKVAGEKIFRRLDHTCIYLMIAGTYTPVCLVIINGTLGWIMFGSIWTMAVVGIYLSWIKNMSVYRRKLSSIIYLGMGWFSLVVIYPIYKSVSWGGIFWLVLGGVLYTVGAIIYRNKSPNPFPRILGFHEIFHFFILAGSFCHFWFMFDYVLKTGI
ncbi:MAG: hemolysin III family protein, partial [Oligoflexales bacterium]|nr:hemolysin III family protein [Oligoflexales bacterium]